jgi:single-strand DNA-binding protein
MVNVNNRVQLIGHIGAELSASKLPSGKSFCRFSLATNLVYHDKENMKQELTDWHKCVAYDFNADILSKYCSKGSHILVEGRLTTRDYHDKENIKRYITEVIVSSILLLDKKKQSEQPSPVAQDEPNPPLPY